MTLPPRQNRNREPSRFDKVDTQGRAEITRLLASGLNVAQVAKRMKLSRETINYHRSPEEREKRLEKYRRWYYGRGGRSKFKR